jgi:predicted ABC-type transport system involved in lysophospholipase L1 biosynthesis ATPase subunit
VLLDGVDLARAPDARRNAVRATEIAFVFQFITCFRNLRARKRDVSGPRRSGRDSNIGFPRGSAAREARARELLDRVGLSSRLRHKPDQLSGGERQRVAIARALMNRPRIVFCDEPTGNLDPKTASGVDALFRELNRDMGQTFVVVTHDIRMADAASRRVHLVDGRTVATPEELPA